jgi:hypothetical protein
LQSADSTNLGWEVAARPRIWIWESSEVPHVGSQSFSLKIRWTKSSRLAALWFHPKISQAKEEISCWKEKAWLGKPPPDQLWKGVIRVMARHLWRFSVLVTWTLHLMSPDFTAVIGSVPLLTCQTLGQMVYDFGHGHTHCTIGKQHVAIHNHSQGLERLK